MTAKNMEILNCALIRFLIIIIKYSRIQTKVFVCLQYRSEKSLLIKKHSNTSTSSRSFGHVQEH